MPCFAQSRTDLYSVIIWPTNAVLQKLTSSLGNSHRCMLRSDVSNLAWDGAVRVCGAMVHNGPSSDVSCSRSSLCRTRILSQHCLGIQHGYISVYPWHSPSLRCRSPQLRCRMSVRRNRCRPEQLLVLNSAKIGRRGPKSPAELTL